MLTVSEPIRNSSASMTTISAQNQQHEHEHQASLHVSLKIELGGGASLIFPASAGLTGQRRRRCSRKRTRQEVRCRQNGWKGGEPYLGCVSRVKRGYT